MGGGLRWLAGMSHMNGLRHRRCIVMPDSARSYSCYTAASTNYTLKKLPWRTTSASCLESQMPPQTSPTSLDQRQPRSSAFSARPNHPLCTRIDFDMTTFTQWSSR